MDWAAIILSVVGHFLLGYKYRYVGVALFFIVNLLWLYWGYYNEVWSLFFLQFIYIPINIKNFVKFYKGGDNNE